MESLRSGRTTYRPYLKTTKTKTSQSLWLMLEILATKEVGSGGPRFKASLGKKKKSKMPSQ
jgi:hypothetical protein